MKTFNCTTCGTCCYGEGGINVTEEEIKKISDFLEIKREALLSDYCYKKNGKFSIKTGPDKFCIFFDQEKACLIHPVKPGICSLWPFFPALVKDIDNWNMAKEACPGINRDCPFEEFVDEAEIFSSQIRSKTE